MELSRRQFLKKSAQATAVMALGAGAFSCATTGSFQTLGENILEKNLRPENYAKRTKNWDPIYGPDLRHEGRYGGLSNYEGHKKDRFGVRFPGTDYNVGSGTPLVPAAPGFCYFMMIDQNGALLLHIRLLSNPQWAFGYVHMDDFLFDQSFIIEKEKRKSGQPFRVFQNNEIVAISGSTGKDFDMGPLPPHVHVNLMHYGNDNSKEYLDFEKYGLDGEKPIFWDGETWLGIHQNQRLSMLEKVLQSLDQELENWNEDKSIKELASELKEQYNHFKELKGTQILDSTNFQNMRTILKKVTLGKKEYFPGTKPYSLAQKVLAYSMMPPYFNQPVIVNLPFISPHLVSAYKIKKPVYEEGPFYQLKDDVFIPVKK